MRIWSECSDPGRSIGEIENQIGPIHLIGGEAIKQSGAARTCEILLATAPGRVRVVPRCEAAAMAVVMPDVRAALVVAGPAAAGMISLFPGELGCTVSF